MSGSTKKCKVPSPLPVRIDEDSSAKFSEPVVQNTPPLSPSAAKQHLFTAPTLPPNHEVEWPKQGGDVDQAVGNVGSPKPPTPMNLGGPDVQRQAAQQVSPVNPEAVAARGAVATPIEQVEGLRTPVANVNWPMASCAQKSCA